MRPAGGEKPFPAEEIGGVAPIGYDPISFARASTWGTSAFSMNPNFATTRQNPSPYTMTGTPIAFVFCAAKRGQSIKRKSNRRNIWTRI